MFIIRVFLFAAILVVGQTTILGQESSLRLGEGVKGHDGIDRIYSDFSKSYKTLDHKLSASLYTKDAAYLLPGSKVITGRPAIETIFKTFFDQVRASGRGISISFDIAQRKIGKGMAYDVGTFEIKSGSGGNSATLGMGKFVVVIVEGEDGKWRFAVDGYNNLPASK